MSSRSVSAPSRRRPAPVRKSADSTRPPKPAAVAQENENDEQATVTRSISLPRAIWPLMDAAAAKENRSRSQWLQVLLRQHFGLPPLTQPVHRNGRA